MGISRSTYYDASIAARDDTAIVEAIAAICDEFECYGWRRVRAELRHRGVVVNHKKIRRLMREHDLQPRRRRRYVATTNSDHDQPIYPNRAKDLIVDGPNQLWVADITYVAIVEGFAYVAVILDSWSRRAVGYAISRSIDVRLTLAALNAAIEGRRPPPGCIHHSDRGSQYAAQAYRQALLRRGFVGSTWSGPLGPDRRQAADLTVGRGLRSSNCVRRGRRPSQPCRVGLLQRSESPTTSCQKL
jgi:putative transposase